MPCIDDGAVSGHNVKMENPLHYEPATTTSVRIASQWWTIRSESCNIAHSSLPFDIGCASN
jgi:hypothetical protein